MGGETQMARLRKFAICSVALVALAACDENGQFALPSASQAQEDAPLVAINAPNQVMTERDVERPDLFSINDRGLWDGRPSLGGAWVAHPDVIDPERVVIRNTENGREITGALFRRERDNPGPLLQVSSDAAEALGLLPGAPTEMSVVVLRREEVEVLMPQADINPVVGSLAAPVNVAATQLDDVTEPEPEAEAAVEVAAPIAAVALPAVAAAATAVAQTATTTADIAEEAADDVIDVSAILSPVTPPADGPVAQIGVFSVQANADAAAVRVTDAGIGAQVVPVVSGGRTVWQVTAGPLIDETGVTQLQTLGFLDAVIVSDTQ